MKKYLKQTNPYLINFYSWHAFSKLSFQEAIGIWMQNLEEIKKTKNKKVH